MIQGAEPFIPEDDRKEMLEGIQEIIKSGQFSLGKHLEEFETAVCKMAGTQFALGVNSCGTGLELIFEALDIRGKEVIVPTETFLATANAVTRAGGKPVFADIDPTNLSLTCTSIENCITENTIAVAIVHMFGAISHEISKVKELCKNKGIYLVEDAAHAHGAKMKSIPAGSWGDIACFSFYATKILTTGEGGAITTNDKDLARKISSLRNHGKDPITSEFIIPGNNFRLAEIPSLIGSIQLNRLPEILAHRRKIASIYRENLGSLQRLTLIDPSPHDGNSYWRYAALLPPDVNREKIQNQMREQFQVRITWMYEPLCHHQPVYSDEGSKIKLPNAEKISGSLINLPTHNKVSEHDAEKVAQGLKKLIDR